MNNGRSQSIVINSKAAVALMEPVTDLVVRAGEAILALKRADMSIERKRDGSPVTEADLAADRIIAEGLARLVPEVAVVSEERVGLAAPPYIGSYFLVDPLDGTKEFLAGRDEFTVNLALVTNNAPLMGVIGAPALGLIWRGVVGCGAERLTTGAKTAAEQIRTRSLAKSGEPWVAAVSRSHGDSRTDAFIAARPGAIRKALGSAVKFGRVAEGQADIYPRLAPTSEWDVAAGHALVTAAGGTITDAQGDPVLFGTGRAGFLVPEFIAWGDPAAASLHKSAR
jgi:3'(2'), 5'-bisphosphate nucleotidase